jgi:RNA polymerase sigma factor (sigma-70 family)
MPNQPHSPSAGTARRSQILKTLLTHHRTTLQRQARKHSARPADAEDALQDACLALLRHYDGPPGIDALRWAMLVTKRCAWALSQPSREHEVLCEPAVTDAATTRGEPVLDAAAEDADPAERSQHHADLLGELEALKPDQRSALVLFAAGYSYAEIGERRGWTKTKVNRSIAEGRASLPSYGRR